MRSPAGPPTGDFVGRERQLELLRARLARAATGAGGVVLITGEPGIGKSRLMQEFAAEARAGAVTVLWGGCHEGDWTPPYGPWAEALGEAISGADRARLARSLGPGAPLLATLLPELLPVIAVQPPTALPGPEDRARFYDAVERLLLLLLAGRSGLLMLDDLHWADGDSLALLHAVARLSERAPLLIVIAYREQALEPSRPFALLLAHLRRNSAVTTIRLRGLSPAAVAGYLAATLSPAAGTVVSDVTALADALHADTGGNPFYLREVVRYLLDEQGGDLGAAVTALADALHRPELTGPLTTEQVRWVLGQRLALLSLGTATLLRIASIFPGAVDFKVLVDVTDLDEESLLSRIDEAVAAGLMQPVPSIREQYDFVHGIVRRTLYEELSLGQRVRLHQRAAEALERCHAGRLEPYFAEVARHYLLAAPGGDAARAAAAARRAGDQALALLAFGESARWYRRALDLLSGSRQADLALGGDLSLALAEARGRAGDIEGARETYLRAAEQARALLASSPGERAAALLAQAALGVGRWWPGDRVDAFLIALLREALAALGDSDGALRAMLLARLSVEVGHTDGPHVQARLSEQALALARRAGSSAALMTALEARHAALMDPDHLAERSAVAADLVRLAGEAGDGPMLLQGAYWLAPDLLEAGDLAALDDLLMVAAREAERQQQPYYLWIAHAQAAGRALIVGEFGRAATLIDEAYALGSRVQPVVAAEWRALQCYSLHREQGRLTELEPDVARASAGDQRRPALQAVRAALLAETGRAEEARRALHALVRDDCAAVPRAAHYLVTLALLSDVCVALEDAVAALTLYRLLAPYAGRVAVVGPAAMAHGTVAHHLAVLARTTLRHAPAAPPVELLSGPVQPGLDGALRHFALALSEHQRMDAPAWLARSRYEYAALLLFLAGTGSGPPRERRDLEARALPLLKWAGSSAVELGMTRLAEEVRRARAAISKTERRTALAAPPRYPDGLTGREVDVLALIAAGSSTRAIAERLVLSPATVERHITNLYAKIGARGRADATAYAIRHRLIVPEAPTPE